LKVLRREEKEKKARELRIKELEAEKSRQLREKLDSALQVGQHYLSPRVVVVEFVYKNDKNLPKVLNVLKKLPAWYRILIFF